MSRQRPAPLEADLPVAAMLRELEALREESKGLGPTTARLLDPALFDPALEILARSGKGLRARLVEHAWALAGGKPERVPVLVPVAIELLHAGSLVIDDIEDDSAMRRGRPTLHRLHGLPLALNTGNWLYFLSLSCLARVPCDDACRLALSEDLATSLLRCHAGQALDLSLEVTSLPRTEVAGVVRRTVSMKTGTLMGLAGAMGARCAGASADVVERVRAFGSEAGIALQMLDDWSGIHNDGRRDKGLEDLRLRRLTWPWAWLAEHADQVSYADLARRAQSVSIDWELDQVRERIRGLLAPVAPGLIEAQLDFAKGLLKGEGVDPEAAAEVERELEALAGAYG